MNLEKDFQAVIDAVQPWLVGRTECPCGAEAVVVIPMACNQLNKTECNECGQMTAAFAQIYHAIGVNGRVDAWIADESD